MLPVCEMVQRMGLSPLVHLVVLIDVAGLRAGHPIERRDRSTAEASQRPENRPLLLRDLSPFELVDHLVAFLDRALRQLLGGVLAAEGLQVAVGHRRVDVDAILLHWRRFAALLGRALRNRPLWGPVFVFLFLIFLLLLCDEERMKVALRQL